MKEIKKHIEEIKRICDSNKVKSLFVFGSAAINKLKLESDIDLLVEINETDPIKYSDCYFALKFALEKIFKRQIDLLEKHALKNPFFKERIEKTMVSVYEK